MTLLAVSGCAGPGSGGLGAADCTTSIRRDGVVFLEYAFVDRAGPRLGTAERSSCEDSGENPRGSTFDGDAGRVQVRRLADLDPTQVLAVPSRAGGFSVFFRDDLTDRQRRALERQLPSR